MSRIVENNQVTIIGEIASGFNFSHELYGEKFYIVDVNVQRISSTYDIVPVMVSDRLVDIGDELVGSLVRVTGQFRSYNRHEETRNRLLLSVFAREIAFVDEIDENEKTNQIFLDGYICKEPIFRKTPLGREIADVLLAVNRPYGKSDYIPCICWGRNASYVCNLGTGSRIAVVGRVQSRSYVKTLDDGTTENRTAYEVSVSKLEVVENAD